jgi:protein-S-isoprenylcysteine O-methyltransferase Ste14
VALPKPDSAGVVVLPPVAFAFCLVGGIAAAFAYGGWLHFIPALFRWPAGLIVIVAGGLVAAWGLDRFRSHGVNVRPDRPVAQLITTGAYRLTRNPMYVGLVSFLIGLGMFLGSIPILLSAVVMFIYLDRYVIPREEAYLTRAFGDDYRDLCDRVHRWL